MAISQDASTPGAGTGTVNSGTLTVTTPAAGSFSPPPGSLVVAIVSMGRGTATPSLSISDTGSHTWNAGPAVNGSNTSAWIYWTYLPDGATAIRVSVTNSTSEGQGIQLDVRVLTGAAQVQTGAGSATNTGTSTSWTGTLTTTQVNSWVMVAAAGNAPESSVTANANTSTLNNYQVAGESSQLSGEQATPTVITGATVFGWTAGSSTAYAWAALEILPACATAVPLGAAVRAKQLPLRRGRIRSNQGAPVQNPPAPTSGPPLSRGNPAGVRCIPVRTGVAMASPAGPVRNLTAGPVFRQAATPARPRIIPPPRGRVTSGKGAPVHNPAPPPPTSGPPLSWGNPAGVRSIQVRTGIGMASPAAPVENPVVVTGNIAVAPPLAFSGTAANQGFTFLFQGPYAVYYLDYEDSATQEVLHCVPGTYYSMFVASGRAPGLLDPPRDGRWLGYPAFGFMVVLLADRAAELRKGRAHNSARHARMARGEKPAPQEPGLPEITCEGRISIPPPGVSA